MFVLLSLCNDMKVTQLKVLYVVEERQGAVVSLIFHVLVDGIASLQF